MAHMESFPINLEPFLGYWALFGQMRNRELNPIQLKVVATHTAFRLYELVPDYVVGGSLVASILDAQGITDDDIQLAKKYVYEATIPAFNFYQEFKGRWDSHNCVYTITEYEELSFFLVNVDLSFGDTSPGMIQSIMDYEVSSALDRGEEVPDYFIKPKLEG